MIAEAVAVAMIDGRVLDCVRTALPTEARAMAR
jgi:hypothetical protein